MDETNTNEGQASWSASRNTRHVWVQYRFASNGHPTDDDITYEWLPLNQAEATVYAQAIEHTLPNVVACKILYSEQARW